MAYRKTNYRSNRRTYRRATTKMGKTFRTRKGKLGCYKYVNGRRVGFVTNLKDVIKCPKCQSPLSDPVYITGHDVFHCQCQCGYEWVE